MSHNWSAIPFEITKVWTSWRTASAEFACSSWMTDSIGSNLTRSLYFMAVPSVGCTFASRNDDGFCLLELHEFRVAGFGIDQRSVFPGAVPRGDDGSVTARYLEQTQGFDLQGGVEKDFEVVEQH